MTDIKQALPIYGRGLLADIDREYFSDSLVFCAPEAWELVKGQFPSQPRDVIQPASMEQSELETQIQNLPLTDTVFGIGGGSACDAAKMMAAMNGAGLILMPTILSVDAAFTRAVGVRVNNRVRYVEDVFPDHLLIDFDVLQKAPKHLNRVGVGDIFSIYTALHDWKLAAREMDERYAPDLAGRSRALLDRMIAGADSIRNCTEEGLKLLSELYVAEVGLCETFGNSRPEEGSEHYLAYCLESLTHRPYIHGQLVAMSVLLTMLYQGQDTREALDFIESVEVDFTPEALGCTENEIEETLLALPSYLEEETQLPYGIFHHRGMDENQAVELLIHFNELIA